MARSRMLERVMATTLKPEMEARVANLATRLGFDSSDASEQVLDMALEYLEGSVAGRERGRTPPILRWLFSATRGRFGAARP